MSFLTKLHDAHEALVETGHNPIKAMVEIARNTEDDRIALEANYRLAQIELGHAKLMKDMQTAPVSFIFNAPKELIKKEDYVEVETVKESERAVKMIEKKPLE